MNGERSALALARQEQAQQALLPVDIRGLQRAARLLEPRSLKLAAAAAAGGAALLSLLGTVGRARICRAAAARELRRQLAPIGERLAAIEAQNEALRRQNEELRRQLEKRG